MAAGACCVVAATAAAEPYLPTDDAVVLERLPSPDDRRLQKLRVLADSLSDRPDDLELALDVARRYVALGTAEGDPRYFGLAQGALRAWWEEPEPPAGVRLVRAAVSRAQHDFDGALADLDAVLAANPSHAQAHLDRARCSRRWATSWRRSGRATGSRGCAPAWSGKPAWRAPAA